MSAVVAARTEKRMKAIVSGARITTMTAVVSFHAHPDDEVLLTGGTLARLAAEGHRVVIVMATDGDMGQATGRRLSQLRESAAALGVATVVHLGYADSGHGPVLFPDPPDRQRFARADVAEAAAKLAAIIREEGAGLLLSYPANGVNGHRDHVKVHQVGARAAQLAGNVRVLEATAPRELAAVAFWPVRVLGLVTGYRPRDMKAVGTPQGAITHPVTVRAYARQKKAALAAHQSQLGVGRGGHLMRLLTRLPVPVFALLCGREWLTEPNTTKMQNGWPAGSA